MCIMGYAQLDYSPNLSQVPFWCNTHSVMLKSVDEIITVQTIWIEAR